MEWKPIIYRYSLHLTRNRWDAEDLAQDALIKVLNAVGKDPERPITNAFLYRIVKNTWLDINKKRRLPTVAFDPSHEPSASDNLLTTRELLELVAERLPPKMAVILLLMDVFDFTAKETAEFVQMKEKTVQVTLGRARLKLKEWARSPVEQPLAVSRNQSLNANKAMDFEALVEAFNKRSAGQIDPGSGHPAGVLYYSL